MRRYLAIILCLAAVFSLWAGIGSEPGAIADGLTQLTLADVTVLKEKFYDGRTETKVLSMGAVMGIKAADDVAIVPSAYFNDAAPGKGKTITATFALTGNDAGKYLLPVSQIFTDGEIIKLSWSVYGGLPNGVTFDAETGALGGAPAAKGDKTVLIFARDTNNPSCAMSAQVKINATQEEPKDPVGSSKLTMRGVWLTLYNMEAWVIREGWGSTEYAQARAKANFDVILDTMVENNLNALFVHVRPFMDSLYPSDIFPKSRIFDASGGAGKQGGVGKENWLWDPLEYVIAEAHKKGIEVHAWINPYRVAASPDVTLLHPDNPVRRWLEDPNDDSAVSYVTNSATGAGFISLNPAREKSRNLIISGVKEVIDLYPEIDGIHFDDYFYPTTDAAFDAKAFAETGLTTDKRAGWRRENVNTLIRKVYGMIKAANPNIVFGVSPQGNNDNNYNGQYCDISLWLRTPGYVDYIAPQCYWGYEHNANINGMVNGAQFLNCIKYWTDLPRDPSVRMIIGIAPSNIGRLMVGGSSEWVTPPYDKIGRMVEDVYKDERRSGFILFDYDGLFKGNLRSAQESTVLNREFTDRKTMEIIAAKELENFKRAVNDRV